jgi:hypothetical protein
MEALKTIYGYERTIERKVVSHRTSKWDDTANQRSFFDQLAVKLNVKKPEDWYSVGLETICKNGGSFIMTRYKGRSKLTQGMNFNQVRFHIVWKILLEYCSSLIPCTFRLAFASASV